MNKPFDHAKTVSVKFVLTVLGLFFSLLLTAFVVTAIFLQDKKAFDEAAFRFFNQFASERYYHITEMITFFGTTQFLLPCFLLLLLYFILTRQWKYAIELGILGASSTGLLFGLKELFRRERPSFPVFEQVNAYSFPSGHALLSFILCSFLVYWTWSRKTKPLPKYLLTIFLLFFSLCLGISRIILRVHYATDVVAGFCIALSWLLANYGIQQFFLRRRMRKAKKRMLTINKN